MKQRTDLEKIKLTNELLRSIRFAERLIGLNDDGSLKTEPVGSLNDWFIGDAQTPGLWVRVTRGRGSAKAALRFCVRKKLGGRPLKIDCGVFPATNIDAARRVAAHVLNQIKVGINPNQEKKKKIKEHSAAIAKEKLTFGFIVERDKENKKIVDAKKTADDRKHVCAWLQTDVPVIWETPVFELSAANLQEMIETIKQKRGATSAVKVWRYTRAAWNRLLAGEIPPVDPFAEWMKTHTLPKVAKRTRAISASDDTGKAWLQAVAQMRKLHGSRNFSNRVQADYILLSLCWGSRRSEAARLKVEDVNFDADVPYCVFTDTKNTSSHVFPLTKRCAQILRERIADNKAPRGRDFRKLDKGEPFYISEFVFPSPKRGKHLVEARTVLAAGKDGSGMKIDMHDLRRGFASAISQDILAPSVGAGGDLALVKLAMNHSDIKNDITMDYAAAAKLRILRPIYERQESRVFEAAGLIEPDTKNEIELEELIAALREKAGDETALAKIKAALAG